MDELYHYMIRNMDYEGPDSEEPEEKVCICSDHYGKAPVFCEACNDWTDNIELAAEVPYSEERAAENRLLLENFNRVMAETKAAMAAKRMK